jgi:hypothetical protein
MAKNAPSRFLWQKAGTQPPVIAEPLGKICNLQGLLGNEKYLNPSKPD